MKIKVSSNNYEIIFALQDCPASKSLYNQLPIKTKVEQYGDKEKIFYPPIALDTSDTPRLDSGGIGTLGYFSPWHNVVMYYGTCGPYSGLYVLGQAIASSQCIKELSGTIVIEREDA